MQIRIIQRQSHFFSIILVTIYE